MILPIAERIADIRRLLAGATRLVLSAPPGAGKTTLLPLALFDEGWNTGKRLIILEPRRIAARMAAERMASLLKENVGEKIGLSTRIDRRVSAETRIEVVTDGLLARRLLADPELGDVGAILFDEFHERSLAGDLGLALALESQSALRPDLRLVIMSATLDAARIASRFDAPIISSEGRQFPIETIYLGRNDTRLEDDAARAIRRALRESGGSVLAFLPGRAEILRVRERLVDLPGDVVVAPLYGALSPQEQDAAVKPALNGERKVVLATDIAESSLTIEGVAAVVDAGLARVAEYDAESGARLVTERASRASVDQRRGRAGRLGPGRCYRLWEEAETRGLKSEPTPEILSSDLSGLVLALAEWGEKDPMRLSWIDPPPAGRVAAARAELLELGALNAEGDLTALGREIARLPLEPRLAAMIASAKTPADKALAAEIAALLSERGLGGNEVDLVGRLSRFRRDGSSRAKALGDQAARWAGGVDPAPLNEAGRILAGAMPSRIARAKPGESGAFLMANGRLAKLDPSDPLAGAAWLAIAEATGARAGARILAAVRLTEKEALEQGAVSIAEDARYDPQTQAIKARRVKSLGAIVLSETPLPNPSGPAARRALFDALSKSGLDLLPASAAVREFQARLSLARREFGEVYPDWTDHELLREWERWLAPLLGDPPALDRPQPEELRRALLSLMDWNAARKLEEAFPREINAPSGRALRVDYLAEGGPLIEARVQEFYGATTHPAIAGGRLALSVSLLSPAHRQIALTKNLPGFWSGGYRDMAKDMRGRYPKHDWPEDPGAAKPHEGRTKARL